jgi:hypothetical protein
VTAGPAAAAALYHNDNSLAQVWRYCGEPLAFDAAFHDKFSGVGEISVMYRLLIAAVIAAPLLGCASVTRGTTENISIATTPSGATAEIAGLEAPTACVTPCVVEAKRNAEITITLHKEGYQTQKIPLTKEIVGAGAAGFAGNLLAGGLVGMGVDAATGAAQDHKPNPVIVTLKPRSSGSSPMARPRPPKQPAPES